MAKTAIISIDLSTVAGTMKFVPGSPLPRQDKKLLERTIAATFLAQLSARDGSIVMDVESHPSDPPDVTFRHNGQPQAIELVELVPENRLEKDAIIRNLRRGIISRLVLSEETAGYVVQISLVNDYAARLRPGRIEAILADALTTCFARPGDGKDLFQVPVPDAIRDMVNHIYAFRENLKGDPRLNDDREPLIVFGAQNTRIVPELDCPAIVNASLGRKQLHDVDPATWLLVWSNHHSLASLRNELDNAIGFHLRARQPKYGRVFHLHLFPGGGVTEFPMSG